MNYAEKNIAMLEQAMQNATEEGERLRIALELVEAQKAEIEALKISERAVADATVRMAELYVELEDAQDQITLQQNEILQQNEELTASLDQLRMINEHLEELHQANQTLQEENERTAAIKKAHHDLISSVNYSKRIQFTLLPDIRQIRMVYPSFFALYLPRDIVSGDFYWFYNTPHHKFLVAADCTGHGVAGAFMMLLGCNLLEKLICQWCVYEPSELLYEMDLELRKVLKQEMEENIRDSMEMCVFVDNRQDNLIQIAGAKRPFVRFRDGEMLVEKGDKFPVGDSYYSQKKFHTYTLDRQAKDRFYFFTDGFCDQFGSEGKGKLSTKRLLAYLQEIQSAPISTHQFSVQKFFQQWKGGEAQLDDVMMLGLEL